MNRKASLSQSDFGAFIDTFCEDLLSSKQIIWADACLVGERTLAQLMDEIDAPTLRRQASRLCVEIAEVDSRVTDGELIVLAAAVEHRGVASRDAEFARRQHVGGRRLSAGGRK